MIFEPLQPLTELKLNKACSYFTDQSCIFYLKFKIKYVVFEISFMHLFAISAFVYNY